MATQPTTARAGGEPSPCVELVLRGLLPDRAGGYSLPRTTTQALAMHLGGLSDSELLIAAEELIPVALLLRGPKASPVAAAALLSVIDAAAVGRKGPRPARTPAENPATYRKALFGESAARPWTSAERWTDAAGMEVRDRHDDEDDAV